MFLIESECAAANGLRFNYKIRVMWAERKLNFLARLKLTVRSQTASEAVFNYISWPINRRKSDLIGMISTYPVHWRYPFHGLSHMKDPIYSWSNSAAIRWENYFIISIEKRSTVDPQSFRTRLNAAKSFVSTTLIGYRCKQNEPVYNACTIFLFCDFQ